MPFKAGSESAQRAREWSRDYYADPAVRASHGRRVRAGMVASGLAMSEDQVTQIVAEIRANPKRRYIDIAQDWLCGESNISRIAIEAGIFRRGPYRKKGQNND